MSFGCGVSAARAGVTRIIRIANAVAIRWLRGEAGGLASMVGGLFLVVGLKLKI